MNLLKRLRNLWELSRYEMPTDKFYETFIEATERAVSEKPVNPAIIIRMDNPVKKIITEE